MSFPIDDLEPKRGDRKVLMIAYAFPPTGGPGVQRSAKFAKYLPQCGWLPTVWTADEVDGLPRDPTLCGELPSEVVVCPRNAGSGILAMRRSLRGFVNARAGEGLTAVASRFAEAMDWRLEAWQAATLLPDDCIAWARRSVGPLTRQIRTERFDVIYSTYSPASNHWLALELKHRTNLPWVADFRDLWTDDCRYREPSPQRRAAHRRLEQDILEAADMVIAVSERQRNILADHLPEHADKVITITNGFDPADFAIAARSQPADGSRFVLTFVGRFQLARTGEELFGGLRRFVEGLAPDSNRFLLRVVGYANKTVQTKLRATGVQCEFVDYVPHEEAIRAMYSSDALLLKSLTGRNGDSVIPAKLFEYLASGRPILAIGPQGGECERIVRSCSAGLTVDFDETAIADALERLFDAWTAGRPIAGCGPEGLEAYSRIELTRRLALVFDRLADRAAESVETADESLETCPR